MSLIQLKQTYPNYQELTDEANKIDFESFEVYTGVGDRVGTVQDVLVDEDAQAIRYLIVHTGFWIFGKQILVPIGLVRFDYDSKRMYIDGLKKQQVETLPEYKGQSAINQDYEEMVRRVFRPMVIQRGSQSGNTLYDRKTYHYDQDPGLYTPVDQNSQQLDQYAQHLIAHGSSERHPAST